MSRSRRRCHSRAARRPAPTASSGRTATRWRCSAAALRRNCAACAAVAADAGRSDGPAGCASSRGGRSLFRCFGPLPRRDRRPRTGRLLRVRVRGAALRSVVARPVVWLRAHVAVTAAVRTGVAGRVRLALAMRTSRAALVRWSRSIGIGRAALARILAAATRIAPIVARRAAGGGCIESRGCDQRADVAQPRVPADCRASATSASRACRSACGSAGSPSGRAPRTAAALRGCGLPSARRDTSGSSRPRRRRRRRPSRSAPGRRRASTPVVSACVCSSVRRPMMRTAYSRSTS